MINQWEIMAHFKKKSFINHGCISESKALVLPASPPWRWPHLWQFSTTVAQMKRSTHPDWNGGVWVNGHNPPYSVWLLSRHLLICAQDEDAVKKSKPVVLFVCHSDSFTSTPQAHIRVEVAVWNWDFERCENVQLLGQTQDSECRVGSHMWAVAVLYCHWIRKSTQC